MAGLTDLPLWVWWPGQVVTHRARSPRSYCWELDGGIPELHPRADTATTNVSEAPNSVVRGVSGLPGGGVGQFHAGGNRLGLI